MRMEMRRGIPIAVPIMLAGCAATVSAPTAWWSETALQIDATLGGCAIGDIDPRHAGNEIAVVAADGRVLCVRRDGAGWSHELVAQLPGEQIQCAVGDILPHPGDELVTVGVAEGGEDDGGAGVAWVFGRGPDGWWRHELLHDEALLHAVAIGDVDPVREGAEVVLAGFSREIHLLVRDGGGHALTSAEGLPGNAKGAAVGLGGAVIACDDGSLVSVLFGGGQILGAQVLETYPAPLARVAASGSRVLVCANDGRLRLWDGEVTTTFYESADRLRGAVLAELDPRREGVEMATAGYDGRISLLWLDRDDPGGPRAQVLEVARDVDRLHHLTAGELPGLGVCLVACGYSGRVTVAGRLKN